MSGSRSQGSWRDLLLPFLVVGVVAMMILPLPSAVLDVLLMSNFSFALILLISAVYLSEPERFTSLPTALLLATVFRLGLNISTTRQLLSYGEAPSVVVAFGEFVVGGNIIVGLTVFAIITLIQFIVIAKGAERVAEVAARFTLDALPGKQMSIDADVRAGALSLFEARERRSELHRESKLYGALDGSMKFVKGDAIAGLVITLINIGAGFLVGISQLGLSFSESIERFTIFTVGDGLVSQIPALLVSVAAGICITRVSDKQDSLIGRELFSQLAREPQALATTGFVLCLFGGIPGLPTGMFVVMGVLLMVLAGRIANTRSLADRERVEQEFRPKLFSPLVLKLTPGAARVLQAESILPEKVRGMRHSLFEGTGVLVPELHYDLEPEQNAGLRAWVYLRGVEVAEISTEKETDSSMSELLAERLNEIVLKYLPDLMDDTHTRTLLEVHQPVAEDLINSVVGALIETTALTGVLRQLVIEEVSIRDMNTILQAIAEFSLESSTADKISKEGDGPQLLSYVRIALSRTISSKHADSSGVLRVHVLESQVDHLLSKQGMGEVPFHPEIAEQLVKAVREVKDNRKFTGDFVLLCTSSARKLLSDIVKDEIGGVYVVSIDEISRDVSLEIVSNVSLGLKHGENTEGAIELAH